VAPPGPEEATSHYLRCADKRLGLPINFHLPVIKDGITRTVNKLEDDNHAKPPGRKEV
jgi:hypothetical protein